MNRRRPVSGTILIIDDHPLFRRGLRRMIEESGSFQVIAEASSAYEAIQLADVHDPHVILSDIQLPGITGLKTARILTKQHPNSKLIFFSMHMDDERLLDAVRAGAAAFLTKDAQPEELLDVIGRVIVGEQPIYATVMARQHLAQKVLTEFRTKLDHPGSEPAVRLSARELEVLDCVVQGMSNQETADRLFITEQTVKNHMTNVLRKLNVTDRVEALLYAVQHGWVEIGSERPAAPDD